MALVANATVSFARTSLKGWPQALIAVVAAALFGWEVNPVLVIILAGALGLVIIPAPPAPQGSAPGRAHLPHNLKAVAFMGAVAAVVFLALWLWQRRLAPYFDRLRSSPVFTRTISGVRCCFVGLLLTVTIRFGWQVRWDWFHAALAVGAFTALFMKVDILWVVLVGTAASILAFWK